MLLAEYEERKEERKKTIYASSSVRALGSLVPDDKMKRRDDDVGMATGWGLCFKAYAIKSGLISLAMEMWANG